MLHISPLRDNARNRFYELFTDYYGELGCDDNCEHLLNEYVMPDLLSGLIRIDILDDDGAYAGFIVYQTDDIENDWNLKEGWGDIREIYVIPSHRRRGLGKFMLYAAELKLRESGAQRAYCLPAEGSEEFFKACGYKCTDEYNSDLNCNVFIKENLENKCKN